MTSFLHLVSDDFSGIGLNWASRVGGYTAQNTGFQSGGGGPPETKSGTLRKSNHTYGLNIANNPAAPIVPGPGLVRTVEMIMAFDGTANPSEAVVLIGRSSTNQYLSNTIASDSGSFVFQAQNGVASDTTTEAFANPTKFHYLTWVYDFSVLPLISWRMYDQGVLLESHTSSVPSTGWVAHQSSSSVFNIALGGSPTLNLLELLIHDVALTDDQVAQRSLNCRIFAG